jgi:hypothetical protein
MSRNFIGLYDTASPLAFGSYVQWNSTISQLVYSTTTLAKSIFCLARDVHTDNNDCLYNSMLQYSEAIENIILESRLQAEVCNIV